MPCDEYMMEPYEGRLYRRKRKKKKSKMVSGFYGNLADVRQAARERMKKNY